MLNYYLNAFRKFADFSGRARRSEYWFFYLMNILIQIASYIIGIFFAPEVFLAFAIYSLVALIPGLAVSVRRLHDINRSGFWIFISLVPLVGPIIFLVFMCTAGDIGVNQYGEDPTVSEAGF